MSRRTAKNLNWAGAVVLACLGVALLPVPARAQPPTPPNVVRIQVQPAKKTPSVDEQIEALRRALQQLEEQKRKQKVLTPEEAIKQRPKEKVTVQFKVTSAQTFLISRSNVVGKSAGTSGEDCVLKDGDSFAVQLLPPTMDTIRRLGIEPDKHFKGKVVRVTGLLQPGQPDHGTGEFQIVVTDLTQIEVVKEAPASATPVEKTSPKDAQPERKVLTPEEAMKQKPKEKVTVKFQVTAAQVIRISNSGAFHETATAGYREGLILRDSDSFASQHSFAVQLRPPAMEMIKRLSIEPDKHFKGKMVQVTGLIQPGQPVFGTGQFQIVVNDLTQIEVVEK